jgi:hypothetical protein
MLAKINHAFRRDVEVGVDPIVGRVQPNFVVAFVAPTGGFGLGDLVFGKLLEVFRRMGRLHGILVEMNFAEKESRKSGPSNHQWPNSSAS